MVGDQLDKAGVVPGPRVSSGAGDEVFRKVESDLDQAYLFLASDNNAASEPTTSLAAIRHNVDWRIIPVMFLCYTVGFIDKVSLIYAAVMGINPQLKLKGNDFSNAATAFFAAYMIAEVPTVFILNKVPVAKWLGFNIVLWGIATACTAAAHDYRTLLAARIFLGILEAPIAPCLMLISSRWYTQSEQAPRFAFWYCGLGIGQIVGGLVSFGFQHVVRKHDFQGWRMMFVVLGCVTVAIGLITLFLLPETPMSAKFLSSSEKKVLLNHISGNGTGVHNTQFKSKQLLEALADPQLWLLTFMTVLPSISSGVVTTYSATLIKTLGYSSKSAALLNMPSGVISIASSLLVGYGVRRSSNRWVWYTASCLPGMLGGALMSFLPKYNRSGLLAGIYLVNCVTPTVLITYQWTAANIAGSTKRAFGTSLVAAAFGVGNIIGPQTFQAKDAPQFIPAKITVLATQGAGALLAICLFVYYKWTNVRRDRARPVTSEDEMNEVKWANLTDKQNPGFRYVL